MQIGKDSVVTIHYHLTGDSGEVLDSSRDGDPLAYLHGHGSIVPGLEHALEGKAVGELVETTVPPEEAYGEHDPELDLAVPVASFPDEVQGQLQAGLQFRGPHPSDERRETLYQIMDVQDERVLVTGNHPLAGKQLHFEVEVVDVREATDDELAHGHVHGDQCHHH